MDNIIYQRIVENRVIPISCAGKRLDKSLSIVFPEYSRSQLQKWLKSGEILIDNTKKSSKNLTIGEEKVTLDAKLDTQTNWYAQDIKLNIIFEDESILVVNKPVGMVTHPGAGTPNQTLANAVLHHCPHNENLPRCGIVHRLDKDTSGLLVIAKTLVAHASLTEQLQSRSMHREYEAIVTGIIPIRQTVDAPIGRHPRHRIKMAVTPTGKEAITHIEILQHFDYHTRIRCQLETGRTHQIRVHLAHIKSPLLGDQTYQNRVYIPKGCSEYLKDNIMNFKRQALHAVKLNLQHPVSKKELSFRCDVADDFKDILNVLRANES